MLDLGGAYQAGMPARSLYNFRVLDLQRIPYFTAFIKNVYAFVNLGMAGFVMARTKLSIFIEADGFDGQQYQQIVDEQR